MLIAFFTLNIISFGRVLVGNNVTFYRFELILHHSNAVKLGFRYQVNKQHHSYSGVDTVTAPPNMIPDNTAHIAVAFLIFTILPLFQYFLSTDYYSYLCKRIQTSEFIEVLAYCIFFHLSSVI